MWTVVVAPVSEVLATIAIRIVVAVTEPVAIGVAQVVFHWRMTESFVVIGVRGTPFAHVFVCGRYAILMPLLASLVSILIAIVSVGESHRRSRQWLSMCGTQAPIAPERQRKSKNCEKHGSLSSHENLL
jgi:formate hydrogenlyase subunit 3/multisubunit Na+/H+ antiporter MnhD subunit